jgi:hypothetical protein
MNKTSLHKIIAALTITLLAISLTTTAALAATSPAPAPAGSSFDQRLVQRKAEQTITLSDNDQKRLITACTTAQSKIRLHETAIASKITTFGATYQRIDARLWAITGQLKLANQDTFKLEKDRLDLVSKIASFQATASSYQQTLDDATVVNCQADPTGFKALLETNRFYLKQLRSQSSDVYNYVVNTVKPELSGHVSDLQPKTPTAGGN